TYQYKHDGIYANMNLPIGNQYGLVAQDIETVLPELVTKTSFESLIKNDGESKPTEATIDYKCVNYIGLIPVLVSAIQEQQKEIELLKKQVAELAK
ncbi:MAG: hypothetical protein WCJ33_08145, partial [Pseudomonadota bacterium]